MSFCSFGLSDFCFEDSTLVLIAPAPGHCLLFTVIVKGCARKPPPPQLFITDHSKAVVLMWSHLAVLVSEFRWFVHCIFSSVWVAEWPSFGK